MFKNWLQLWLIGMLVGAFTASPLCYAEGNSWNPFSTKQEPSEKDPEVVLIASSSQSKSWWPEWKMPKMPWTTAKKSPANSYTRREPSRWQKMSKTTKRWWNKTADILDPYPDPKPASQTQSDKPLFGEWFGAKKEPNKIENVTDYLKQPVLK